MNKIEKIDYDYVISLFKEAQEIYERTDNYELKYSGSLFFKIYKNYIPEFIKNLFIRPFVFWRKYLKENKIYWFPQDEDKKWSIDFINYIIQNPKTEIDLNLFNNERDKKEIIKFIRNKIFSSFANKLNKKLLFDEKDLKFQKEYKKFEKKNVKEKLQYSEIELDGKIYKLPENYIGAPFFHKLNLKEINKNVFDRYQSRVALDCGAYIGDTALILSEYFNKVYALEPVSRNFKLLKKTIKLNRFGNKIIPLKLGVGYKEEKVKIKSQSSTSYIPEKSEIGNEMIIIKNIDNIVKENNLKIGLIKMDIEGYEFEAIKGAERTIKNQKPILIISLYHRGKDFFEIPNLIKNWIPEYKFRFVNLNHNHPFFERNLICYIDSI